jgi:hypothetical protein
MKYKVTTKYGICQFLSCCRAPEIDCIDCGESIVVESTNFYTQEEYLNLLKRGNVYITKVDVE